MAYAGYVVEVKELRKHSNADRLQVATFFGNDTCIDMSVNLGDWGVYFPTDGQLSPEFCVVNNLVRRKDENGNNVGGYMDPAKRNVTTINLRKEKSDGLYLPLSCLNYCFDCNDASQYLKPGDMVTVVNGHDICTKYIPNRNKRKTSERVGKTRKAKVNIAPLFKEHIDTEQLAYNLGDFRCGDQVEITLKMHGTSQRTGYLPVLKKMKRTLWDKITKKEGTPIYEYDYVTGTRRVVLEDFEGGFYGSNAFRKQHEDIFRGKLHKGETVYYEVVGYVDENTTIMGIADNKKTKDKEFIKTYGEKTTFSYGCEPGESHVYVYRMTMTNEDGDVVEYSPEFMRYRCEQMNVDTVPVFAKFFIPEPLNEEMIADYMLNAAEEYFDGTDPIGKTHIREGVVCRIVNRPSFSAYKHKNFSFKMVTGIIKEQINAANLSEDILNEL